MARAVHGVRPTKAKTVRTMARRIITRMSRERATTWPRRQRENPKESASPVHNAVDSSQDTFIRRGQSCSVRQSGKLLFSTDLQESVHAGGGYATCLSVTQVQGVSTCFRIDSRSWR